jgi:hypothetical protein
MATRGRSRGSEPDEAKAAAAPAPLDPDSRTASGSAPPLELTVADMLDAPLPAHMPAEMFTGPGLLALADLLPIMTAYVDRGEVVRFVNRPMADYLGAARSTLLDRPVRALMGEDVYPARKGLLAAVCGGEQ